MLSTSRLPSLAEVSAGDEVPPAPRERAGADPTRASKSVFARLVPWTTEASPSTLLNRSELMAIQFSSCGLCHFA
ncbi:hypothetical protein Y032_0415g1067 [Ancylostoma ceylanicum]|uniref:Uncharacterized protein n=1 Tax=Ancylostoma ceylanicum TaxID=53326 RepID=A0A016X1V4_9BILA|nr:hypothetical protein Y032_0415g1067 [Ancylostoma ceylanicum]